MGAHVAQVAPKQTVADGAHDLQRTMQSIAAHHRIVVPLHASAGHGGVGPASRRCRRCRDAACGAADSHQAPASAADRPGGRLRTIVRLSARRSTAVPALGDITRADVPEGPTGAAQIMLGGRQPAIHGLCGAAAAPLGLSPSGMQVKPGSDSPRGADRGLTSAGMSDGQQPRRDSSP